jgi:hypothetical protein
MFRLEVSAKQEIAITHAGSDSRATWALSSSSEINIALCSCDPSAIVLALGRSAVLQEEANRFSLLLWVSGKSVDGDMASKAPQPAKWYEKDKNVKIQIIESSG